jgi:hypothetical protein
MKKIFVIIAFCLFAGLLSAQTRLWVSPSGSGYEFSEKNPGSLEGVYLRYKINDIHTIGEHNIQVILKEGIYSLNEPVSVSNIIASNPTDTLAFIGIATNPNTNDGKAVVSGGRRVTGWQDAGNGIYKALLPADVDFRQLYVNGKMAIRAREPNRNNDTDFGHYWKIKYFYNDNKKKMVINESEIQEWSDMNDVEMVIHQDWTQARVKVTSFEKTESTAIVSLATSLPGIGWGTIDLLYFWENSMDFLDAEGEWFLNKTDHFLYYKPRSNEDINQVEICYPAIDRLFNIAGTPTTSVQNVYIQNIEFQYSNWASSNFRYGVYNQGVFLLDTDVYQMHNIVGSLFQVTYANNVRISNCNIIGAGGNGIVFDTKVKNSEITACHFNQIAANGIMINGNKVMQPEALLCTDDLVANNLIENFTMNYPNGSSLYAGSVHRLTVEHNEIRYGQFSGLHLGNANPYERLFNNLIRANNVHHVCRTLGDGSGLYTTADLPGTLITRNFIHELEIVPWFPNRPRCAIFLDDHSAWITVEDNVCITEASVLQQLGIGPDRNAHDNTIRNNESINMAIISDAGPRIPTGVVTLEAPSAIDYYYIYPANTDMFKITADMVDSVKVEGETPALLNFYNENTVINTLNIADIDSVKFTIDVPAITSIAYPSGIPHAPGIVEAEDFDYGGEGVAYHDVDGVNTDVGVYRTDPEDQGVDITNDTYVPYSNGFAVVGPEPGEWLNYTINAPVAGDYVFSFGIMMLADGTTSFDLVIDGGEPVGRITVSNTNWAVAKIAGPTVNLSEGIHVVTIQFNGSMVFDYFEFLNHDYKYPKTGWTVSANSYLDGWADGGGGYPSLVVDEDPTTAWHSNTYAPLPHCLVIDMLEKRPVGRVDILQLAPWLYGKTAQLWLSNSSVSPGPSYPTWGTPIAEGVFEGQASLTLNFPPDKAGRYLIVYFPDNDYALPYVNCAEVDVYQ